VPTARRASDTPRETVLESSYLNGTSSRDGSEAPYKTAEAKPY
jgi:hypothetical protein